MIEYGVLTGTPNAQLSRCGRVGDGAATWYASPADIPAGGGDADGGAAAGGGDDLSKTGVDGVVPATALGTLALLIGALTVVVVRRRRVSDAPSA